MGSKPNNPRSREVEILDVTDVLQVPAAIGNEHEAFVLFLALDAAEVSDEDLQRVAQALLAQGLAYLCAWGHDCSRVHDQFDVERDDNEQDGMLVTTTWHADETLEEALEFFREFAWPDDGFARTAWWRVAVSVGSNDWRSAMERFLREYEPRSEQVV